MYLSNIYQNCSQLHSKGPGTKTRLESPPCGLFLICRGENIFRYRAIHSMYNDINACVEKEKKVLKALLLGTVALSTRMRTSTRTGPML